MVDYLAYFDYVGHRHPELCPFSHLIMVLKDPVAFEHHNLLDHHAIRLIISILVFMTVLFEFAAFLILHLLLVFSSLLHFLIRERFLRDLNLHLVDFKPVFLLTIDLIAFCHSVLLLVLVE